MNDMAKQSPVDEKKQRIIHCMDCFDCHGWLHVSLHNSIAVVEISHCQSHKVYVSIDLLEKWRTFIENNHKMGPAKVCRQVKAINSMKLNGVWQLWQDILCQTKGEGIAFTQKTICYTWACVASEQWHHDNNPIKSTWLYLEKHGAEEGIKLLEMPEIKGAWTLTFIVDDFVQEWAQHTKTLLVDLTCE